MMLDNHQIVIRERGCLELLDLSLRALRSQAGPFSWRCWPGSALWSFSTPGCSIALPRFRKAAGHLGHFWA